MSACPQPECRSFQSRVLETRKQDNGWIKRRRLCPCSRIWWTFEIAEQDLIQNEESQE
jgi:transcriptional regulator NrdR family protein